MIAGVWIFAGLLVISWVLLSVPKWVDRWEKHRRRVEKRRRRAAKIRRRRRKRWHRRMAWLASWRPEPVGEPEPEFQASPVSTGEE